MVANKIPKSKTRHRIYINRAGRICLPCLTLLGKKEGLEIQPLAEVLLQDPARPPVLLLAIGVALLGVTHALRVGVARGVVVAAGLLEHVGHLSSFLSWTNLIIKEGRGFCNPLHKMNTLILLSKKLQHHEIVQVSVTHKVTKGHGLELAIEHHRTTQVKEQEANVIKNVQRIGHVEPPKSWVFLLS